SQCLNQCVQMFESTTGRFVFQFGGRGSGDLQFDWPWGVGVDREGNLVVCDHGDNGCVKVIEVRPMEWSRKNHVLFGVEFKKAVFFVMVAWSRRGQWIESSRRRKRNEEEKEKEKEKEEKVMNVFAQIPFELIEEIVSFLAAVW